MLSSSYDLIVIGGGPAGIKGAFDAASHGLRVALIERSGRLGGAGLNTGTIPSKTLRETALYFSGLRTRGLYGVDYSLRDGISVKDLTLREREIAGVERDHAWERLRRYGVDVVWGEGRLLDAQTVDVRTRNGEAFTLHAGVVLLAPGSSPRHPPGVPFDGGHIFDSDSVLEMNDIPASMIVVGGGVIGCEYASIFAALDVAVTVVQSGPRLLPQVDMEIAGRLRGRLQQLGVRMLFGQGVKAAEDRDGGAHLTLSDDSRLNANVALFCAGRVSSTGGLGLEAAGVAVGERGMVLVDSSFRTNLPSVYAAGDVVGPPALCSTSMEQARIAVACAFDLPHKNQFCPVLPQAVYTIPEIAWAGRTEAECDAEGLNYLTSHASYDDLARGQIIGDTAGMLKLVFDPNEQRVLGIHIIGELASELIHFGAEIIAEGGTLARFIDNVYNYPTLSELYRLAAYDALENLEQWQVLNKG